MSPYIALLVATALAGGSAPAKKAAEASPQGEAWVTSDSAGKSASGADMRSANKADEAKLTALSNKYRTAKLATMKVDKTLKLGLLAEERKSSGTLWLSNGQLRLELEGAEKTLLVVNKKNVWAVTYPPAEFKDAAIQVIKGETSSAKAKSQALTGLLGSGGFTKSFKTTAVQTLEQGDVAYFLQPAKEQADFKRAQLVVSKDGKSIVELKYWDERDNETIYDFSNAKFGGKADPKMFDFNPPANADVMTL